MRIAKININYNTIHYNSRINKHGESYMKSENTPTSDTVSFSSKVNLVTPSEKMTSYAVELLKELKKGQQVYIKGDAYFQPFMETLSKEAYKLGSGLVFLTVLEPEIEALKEKYHITEEFDYKAAQIKDLEDAQALFFEFTSKNNPYIPANLSLKEVQAELEKLSTTIPEDIRQIFKIEPEDVLKNAMDLHEGQPVFIRGEREHLPVILEFVEYLYSKNKTKLVDIALFNENRKNMLKYADEVNLDIIPSFEFKRLEEYYNKDVAWLILEGQNPKELEGIDAERITRNSKARSAALNELNNKITSNVPWLVYYAPTTKSCPEVYTEFGDDKLSALKKAYEDANRINRVGGLEEHVNNLNYRAVKMNELLEKGYRTLHYISVDEETKLPDGKTDFKITMSPQSIFNSARMDMQKYGHKPLVNIPTEEVFTAPQADTAQGVISATMPLSLNGQIIDGIRLTFDKGRITEIHADKNEEMLKSYINAHENADRLGEVAIVAGSPIAQLGRLFNSTLLDENASCHLALGNAYSDCIKGADEIENYKEQQEFLKRLNINCSPTHTDFMVGGKNVYISAINEETGESINVVRDDKFLL